MCVCVPSCNIRRRWVTMMFGNVGRWGRTEEKVGIIWSMHTPCNCTYTVLSVSLMCTHTFVNSCLGTHDLVVMNGVGVSEHVGVLITSESVGVSSPVRV